MKTTQTGLGFFYNYFLKQYNKTGVSYANICTKFDSHKAAVFGHNKESVSTLLIFPGMSVYGFQDPRIMQLAASFSAQGLRTIVPQIPDLENLTIHPFTCNQFGAIIKSVYSDQHLNPGQKPLGIFAPSYSGGLTMITASRPGIAPMIGSVCLLGSFSNFNSMIDFALSKKSDDDYARLILLKNFIQYSPFATDLLLELVIEAIRDNGFNRSEPKAFEKLRHADSFHVDLFLKLIYDYEYGEQVIRNALSELESNQDWFSLFDFERQLNNVCFPVHLIHGSKDSVIPPSESVNLHQRLTAASRKSFLTISNLISHGDVVGCTNILKDASDLSVAFGAFINDCKNAANKKELYA